MVSSLTDGIDENESPSETRRDVDDRETGPADIFNGADALDAQSVRSYLDLYSEYLKRQLIVYTNWPQYRLTRSGYSNEKVFRDQNT